MGTISRRSVPPFLVALLLAGGCALGSPTGGKPGSPQQVTVQGSEFRFTPANSR